MKAAKRIIGAALYLFAVGFAWYRFGPRACAAAAMAGIGIGIINSATMDELDEMLDTVIEAGFDLVRCIARERGIDLDKGLEAPEDE